VRAKGRGLIGEKPEAAVDATGLESRHTSRYFFARSGGRQGARSWVKLTVACHTASHFFTGATVTVGPGNDSPQFRPVLQQASLAVGWDRVLGDAAFDSEENHRLAREDLGVRSTVIPINRRNRGRKWPKTRYRRQMRRRFPKRQYRQRWQVESTFSQHKRRLGSALTARGDAARAAEERLRALTHNLMILRRAAKGFQQSNTDTDTVSGGCAWRQPVRARPRLSSRRSERSEHVSGTTLPALRPAPAG
jgi:hypothetical protein